MKNFWFHRSTGCSCEYETAVFPFRACCEVLFSLFDASDLQRSDYRVGESDRPTAAVRLGFGRLESALFSLNVGTGQQTLERLADVKSALFHIDVAPTQSKHLATSETKRERRHVDWLKPRTSRHFKQLASALWIERFDRFADDTRRGHE